MGWTLSGRAFEIAWQRATENSGPWKKHNHGTARAVVEMLEKRSTGKVQSTAEMFRAVGEIITAMGDEFESVQSAVDMVEGTGP
jgi:hypothetical protein